jgi:FkbM family methyltransferase
MPLRQSLRRALTGTFHSLPVRARQSIRRAAAIGVRCLAPARRAHAAAVAHWWMPPHGDDSIIRGRMCLGHRMLFDLRSGTESTPFYTGDYDADKMHAALKLLSPGSVCLDVGANVGFWTLAMAKVAGCVHAFEPHPANYARLVQNIKMNGLVVQAHQLGLSDHKATLRLSLREDFAAGASTGNAAIVTDERIRHTFDCININVDTLDAIFPTLALSRLDFVKVDIEGHEDFFLKGAATIISRFRPVMLLEINNWYYKLRDVDPTAFFTGWMREARYCSALGGDVWSLRDVAERTREIEDVFLLPSERAPRILEKLNRD